VNRRSGLSEPKPFKGLISDVDAAYYPIFRAADGFEIMN